jgi:hypothetical protein
MSWDVAVSNTRNGSGDHVGKRRKREWPGAERRVRRVDGTTSSCIDKP